MINLILPTQIAARNELCGRDKAVVGGMLKVGSSSISWY